MTKAKLTKQEYLLADWRISVEKKACPRKQWWESRSEAKKESKFVRLKYGYRTRPYLCSHCSLWHLAKVEDS